MSIDSILKDAIAPAAPCAAYSVPQTAEEVIERARERVKEGYRIPEFAIGPASYARALDLLGLPQGHVLTVLEFYQAAQVESEQLHAT